MEQESEHEHAVRDKANRYLRERRLRIVLEQELELENRHSASLKVTFRKSVEEERLISLLLKHAD